MRKLPGLFLALILAIAVPAFASQAATGKSTQTKAAPASPVNLNTASQSDLEALPGIGPATAKKIIAGRPYAAVADLAKAGVPKSTIDKITPMVTVGSGAAAAAPAKSVAPDKSASTDKSAPPAKTTPASKSGTASVTPQQPPVKGMVWVNLDTKVFHREGDRYYGATKNGKFMTEADALKAGYREAKPSGKAATKKS
jgi:hypothetical protein